MNIYCNLDENGIFVNAEQIDIYTQYEIEKNQVYGPEILEEKGLMIICEEKVGKNKYAYVLDKTGCVFPMYKTIVDGVELYKQIGTKKTRESRKEKIDSYIQALNNNEELQNAYTQIKTKEEIQEFLKEKEETIQEEAHQEEATETPSEEKPVEETPINTNPNDITVILNIKSKKERCAAFKRISLENKKIIINQLLKDGKLKDILVLLTAKESENAIAEFDPSYIKTLYEAMIQLAESENQKNKSTILKYIRLLTNQYPQTTGLYQTLSEDQQKQFFELVSPKTLKIIYKDNPNERTKIEEYLHNERVRLELEIHKDNQLIDLHEEGKTTMNQRDKQEDFTDEEYQLFNLQKPTQLESFFEKRRQKFVDKYHLEPTNADGTSKIVLYDIDKVAEKIPAIDRLSFKTSQQLYLNHYNGRMDKNRKRILTTINTSETTIKHSKKELELEDKELKAKQQKILGLIKFSKEEKKIKQEVEAKIPDINYEPDNELMSYITHIVKQLETGIFQEPEPIEQVVSAPKKSITTISKEKLLILKETIKQQFSKKKELNTMLEEGQIVDTPPTDTNVKIA